jgi:hypothetical protein
LESIINTVLPVFGLIALGIAYARLKLIDPALAKGLTQFVFNLAIPALLFRTLVTMKAQEAMPFGLWLVFFGGLAITWIVTALLSQRFDSLSASGGAAASMAAGFGNLALLGTPLAVAHYGAEAAVPVALIISVHAPVLWFSATLHRELARHSSAISFTSLARELFVSLAGNAIVLALLSGALWRYTGLGLHPVPDRMLASYSLKGQWSGMSALIVMKMLAMPVLVYLAVRYFIFVPPFWAKIAVLLAAMPAGANAFLFAHRYGESVPAVSAAIALGTGLAAITVSLLLYLLDTGLI